MSSRIFLLLATLLYVVSSLDPGNGVVTVYYTTGWTPPYIHYSDDTGVWTDVPGITMDDSTNASYAWYYFACLISCFDALQPTMVC